MIARVDDVHLVDSDKVKPLCRDTVGEVDCLVMRHKQHFAVDIYAPVAEGRSVLEHHFAALGMHKAVLARGRVQKERHIQRRTLYILCLWLSIRKPVVRILRIYRIRHKVGIRTRICQSCRDNHQICRISVRMCDNLFYRLCRLRVFAREHTDCYLVGGLVFARPRGYAPLRGRFAPPVENVLIALDGHCLRAAVLIFKGVVADNGRHPCGRVQKIHARRLFVYLNLRGGRKVHVILTAKDDTRFPAVFVRVDYVELYTAKRRFAAVRERA